MTRPAQSFTAQHDDDSPFLDAELNNTRWAELRMEKGELVCLGDMALRDQAELRMENLTVLNFENNFNSDVAT